jgi:hypothetical protein
MWRDALVRLCQDIRVLVHVLSSSLGYIYNNTYKGDTILLLLSYLILHYYLGHLWKEIGYHLCMLIKRGFGTNNQFNLFSVPFVCFVY